MNRAGKVCLAKSVLSSLPVYAMQSPWLPESVCEFMDRSIRRCIWAKGDNNQSWNLVAWCEVTCPKSDGGLGIRSARMNNVALLGKLVEDLLQHNDKFWVQVLS